VPRKTFDRKASTTVSPRRPVQPFSWDDVDAEYENLKISAELISLQGLGKTYMAATFPMPAFADTEHKDQVVLKNFEKKKWKKVASLADVRAFADACIADPEVKTVVIDSGTDMQDWAEQEFLLEEGKGNTRIFPIPVYKNVFKKIDGLTHSIIDADMNLVLTARVKDEYLNDKRTGRKLRDSYKKYPYQVQLMIQLERGIKDWTGALQFPEFVFGKVIKNGYVGTTFSKPYLIDCSYEGIKREMMNPFFEKGDSEERRKERWNEMLQEAGNTIKHKPRLRETKAGETIRKDITPSWRR
jgi:hypothetical protein